MSISVIVPTKGRPDRFREMVDSARGTAGTDIQIVAVFDEDDRRFAEYDGYDVHVKTPHRADMSGLWDLGWQYASGDIAMLCGDDVIFETDNWAVQVEEIFAEVPDGVVMVYGSDGSQRQAPTLPFVSRTWIETAGEFTPDHLQGWFADEWIWSIAAELRRVVYAPHLIFRHDQRGDDATYQAGQRRRLQLGGLDGMRRTFYMPDEVEQRDQRVARLKLVMDDNVTVVSPNVGPWFEESLRLAAQAREITPNASTLVVVHCWAGDRELVEWTLPIHLRHRRPILILSPEDSPVEIDDPHVECKSIGGRGYFGQVSLDRQRAHLEYLLTLPYEYFLLNDADSMCLSPDIPKYLYLPENREVLWSNEVGEWREHKSPYPKLALQPPYFMHRSVIEKLLTAADKPEVEAHPITPYIDWYMLALAHESGVPHMSFPDGASFPAWRRDEIAETQILGHDFKHKYVEDGKILGDTAMRNMVRRGKVFVHSIKHKPVIDMLLREYDMIHGGIPVEEKVSILVGFRPETDDVWRTRVWKWIEQRWRETLPDAEIIVAEDDGLEPFSKTMAVNNAFLRSRGDVLIVADADAYMDRDAIQNAINVARQTGRLVVPWKDVIRLSEADTKRLLRRKPGTKFEVTEEVVERAFPSPIPETAGTLFVIRRDGFERVQGMDPRFRGWGHEDVAFARACGVILGPTVYGPDQTVSLYHPRPEGKHGRVWANDDGNRNLPLAQAYVIAYTSPWKMQQLVDEHPLFGPPPRGVSDYTEQPLSDAVRIREQLWEAQDQSVRIPVDL